MLGHPRRGHGIKLDGGLLLRRGVLGGAARRVRARRLPCLGRSRTLSRYRAGQPVQRGSLGGANAVHLCRR